MKIDECFQLGYVIKNHGLQGEVNIQLDVDYPQEYKNLESVFIEINDKLVPFFISRLQIRNDRAVVKFEDVNDIEAAEELKSKSLYLPLSMLPELGEGQFYYHQIIGYQVLDVSNGVIGEIKDVYTSSKQDLIVIDHNSKEVLMPVIDDIIKRVNHEEGLIEVELPDGLLDVYLS